MTTDHSAIDWNATAEAIRDYQVTLPSDLSVYPSPPQRAVASIMLATARDAAAGRYAPHRHCGVYEWCGARGLIRNVGAEG